MRTIEEKTSDTIQQKGIQVTIAGKEITAPAVSIATLMEVSALVSKMPQVETNTERIMDESLRVAKDCGPLADILATLVVGVHADGIIGKFIRHRKYRKVYKDVLTKMSFNEYAIEYSKIMGGSEVGSFFGIITSLSGINLLKPTKTINPIPSGPQSPVSSSPLMGL